MRRRPVLAAIGAAALLASPPAAAAGLLDGGPVRSERAVFRVAAFAVGLDHPWGAAFLPDGRLLVTEWPGRMRVLDRGGRASPPLGGLPPAGAGDWQGGLLDVAPAPDFAATREVYFCHGARVQGGVLTRLSRARLSADGTALEGAAPVLDAAPAQDGTRDHFGCRVAFGPRDGKVYLSTGDRRAEPRRAQRLDDLAGKVLRLERDGRPAAGNPFLGRPGGARPEVFSYGHRNPQGLAFNPWTGSLWEAEFGPRGGDEVNVLRAGGNYGWPLATHGVHDDGSAIADRRSAPGWRTRSGSGRPPSAPPGSASTTAAPSPAGAAACSWRR